MSLTITTINTKGGTGKTTLTANIGGLLADLGYRVLMIDTDPQASLSRHYPLSEEAPNGLTTLLRDCDVETTISHIGRDGNDASQALSFQGKLDIVLSDDDQGNKIRDFVSESILKNIFSLKNALSTLTDAYDFILIDTPGYRGLNLDIAVLAADMLICPVTPDKPTAQAFALNTLEVLEQLKPGGELNITFPRMKAVIYKRDRTRDSRKFSEAIKSLLFAEAQDQADVLDTFIPSAVAYRSAATDGMPVHRKCPKQYVVMIDLIKELLPHVETNGKAAPSSTLKEVRS